MSTTDGNMSSTNTAEQTLAKNRTREFTVDRVVRHIGSGHNLKHVIRWYGYSVKDHTIQTPHYILQHFIARYWLRGTKAIKGQKRAATRFG